MPPRLRELPALPGADRERTFTMGMDPETGTMLINGKAFDPNRVDTQARLGTTEIWTVTNTEPPIPHSLHCHLKPFRVLDRNGPAPTDESGLLDVVPIPPGQTVRLAVTFTDYPGQYVYHCPLRRPRPQRNDGRPATRALTQPPFTLTW